ncbi:MULTISPECIES: SRPBCC family protein [unclassified Rhodococcus (in: high G+C Gram-positive bacteria)]|nr:MULTISPECIES: SRPBCC family protein [unclassified Rhodococcus (in: high G+C Gram-positive bacteria)]
MSDSVVIDRPIADVFSYLSDPDKATEWSSDVVDYRMVSGAPDEVGSVASTTLKVAGVKVEATEEITAYEENKRIGFESRDSRVEYTRELDFDGDGDGATRVTFKVDAKPSPGLFKFADSVAMKLYARDVHGNLENAKTILETPNG